MGRLLIFFCLTYLCLGSFCAGGDWPCWRGPHSNGLSSEKNWDPEALTGDSRVSWRINVGYGHSAVVVKNDLAYTMGCKLKNKDKKDLDGDVWEDSVYCINTKTGKIVWTFSYPSKDIHWPGPRSTPAVDEDRVYAISWQGDLHCLNALTGELVWKRQVVKEALSGDCPSGFCGSPVIEGKLLLLNIGLNGVALDKKTGKKIWCSEPKECGLSTPVLYNYKGARKMAIIGTTNMFQVDPKSGKVDWTYRWNSASDPNIVENKIFVFGGSGGYGAKYLDLTEEGPETQWRSRRLDGTFQTSVVINKHAYGFGRIKRRSYLMCIELESGEALWQEDLGEWGSLIAANNKLIILAGQGDLVIAEANPEKFEQISRANIFDLKLWSTYPEEKTRCCWTAPAISNGRLYLRDTYGDVACVDLSRMKN